MRAETLLEGFDQCLYVYNKILHFKLILHVVTEKTFLIRCMLTSDENFPEKFKSENFSGKFSGKCSLFIRTVDMVSLFTFYTVIIMLIYKWLTIIKTALEQRKNLGSNISVPDSIVLNG
jgi:hypothetical protein